jgi:hypothetical protein
VTMSVADEPFAVLDTSRGVNRKDRRAARGHRGKRRRAGRSRSRRRRGNGIVAVATTTAASAPPPPRPPPPPPPPAKPPRPPPAARWMKVGMLGSAPALTSNFIAVEVDAVGRAPEGRRAAHVRQAALPLPQPV